MIVVGAPLGRHVRDHLVRALALYGRQCRADGVQMPAELRDLLDSLHAARDGQERPMRAPADLVADTADMPPLMLTYEGAAKALRVSDRTVRRLVANGQLAAVSVGGARRIRPSDLLAYAEGLATS